MLSFGIILLFIFSAVVPMVFGVNVQQTSFSFNAGETAWWKFDETSGDTVYDSSGHGYHGKVYGATLTGGALSFDGVDDYVDFDNHSVNLGINKVDDLIIKARFKSTGSGMIYSMSHTNPDGPYFDLMLDDEGKITVEIGYVFYGYGLLNLSTAGSYNDGDWHLIEIYYECGGCIEPTLTIYVDGELDGSKTDWMNPILNEDFHTAKVGRDSFSENEYFDGEIDDIKIYIFHYWWGPHDPGRSITVPKLLFDMNPAQKPYDINVPHYYHMFYIPLIR
jgi:hypothetical protein